MLLVHNHVRYSNLLLKAQSKLNLDFYFEFRLRLLSCLENSDRHATTSLGNPKGKGF